MPSVKAPLLDATGKKSKDAALEESVFAADMKPHLVHEAVRAEFADARAGTRALKSRGLVSGGRAKPWRQKGTGRARQGTTRAPHFTGGGVAFMPRTNFTVKINKKERRAAFRSALAAHASGGTLGLLDASGFDEPSTKRGVALLDAWGQERPTVVIVTEEQEALIKSFRNVERVNVMLPSEIEVRDLVWARSLLITQEALELVHRRAA
jgi:large subunit ribosomal protein L4